MARIVFQAAVLTTLVAFPARAQERALPSVPQTLSLPDAVELAVRYSPAFRQAANDRGPAAWGVRSAYGEFLPSLTASGGLSYSGVGSQAFLSQQFSQPSSTVGSNYTLSLGLSLSGSTLMQPGLRRAQLSAAEANAEGARINLRSFIAQQYLVVLQANAQVTAAEVQARRNEEFLRLARARQEVGQGTMLDVRSAEVARGQAEVALLRARNDVTVAKLRLFQQMGVPAPEDPSVITLSDSFAVVEPAWVLSDLLRDAAARNPDLLALRAGESAARAGERAAKSSWFPSLSLSAGWSGFTQQYTNSDFLVTSARAEASANTQACQVQNQINVAVGIATINCSIYQFTAADEAEIRSQNSVFPFSFTRQPFSARLTVSLPIFDQFSRPLQVSEAAARADDAREAVRARELQVRTDVTQAHYGLLTAYQAVRIQQNSQVAAQEQLRLATERYRLGSGTFFELLDAQLAAQRADSDHITAVYDYHKAIAALESAVGRPLR